MHMAEYGDSDPELEEASGLALLRCVGCYDEVGFAWRNSNTGEIESLCWRCGRSQQEDAAEDE